MGLFPRRDIGWEEIGEEFTRWTILWTPWFAVYLHRLKAYTPHPNCHDHPWDFLAIILWGGYSEFHNGRWVRRDAGSILVRPARWSHNVITDGVSWSIIVTGPKRRDWGFHTC